MRFRFKGTIWIIFVSLSFALAGWGHGGFELLPSFTILAICFACELIDSGLGMGYGTILTPTLLAMGWRPDQVVPTVLLSELLSGFTAAFFHNEIRNVDLRLGGSDLKPALILAGGSVAGVTVGVIVAFSLPKDLLVLAIGVIVTTSGLAVVTLRRRTITYRHWKMLSLAGIASFNKAISGGGYGPLVTSGQILSGIPGRAAVGITSFAEAFTCLLAVALFLAKGGYIEPRLFIPMAAGALLSVPVSVFAISRTGENMIKILVGTITIAMGAFTIYRAFL